MSHSSSDSQSFYELKLSDLPKGFRFSGVRCGVKPSGNPDLSLVVADRPVTAVSVTTQNQVVAAPVILCRQRTPASAVRAVVTVSGNANACTGKQGHDDAIQMGQWTAEKVGCRSEEVLVMSTGVIGHFLPMEKVADGIAKGFQELGTTPQHFEAAVEAIRTTDQGRKISVTTVELDGETYRIAAMAKGAGMIAPNMATFLCVFLTDAPICESVADSLLKRVVGTSFNRCSVDGHTSTNDTCLLLCSGDSERELSDAAIGKFESCLTETGISLAKQLVADGEGAKHYMALRVVGAETDADAETVAKTVAASPLVKTAVTGQDPNWGRIVSAAGYAGVKMNVDRTGLRICGTEIYRDGNPISFDAAALSEKMGQAKEVPIELRIGDGSGDAEYWSSDLTVNYVRFNSEYTT